ncbi:hypothetical protein [Clostridium beijerinckii]|uniref:hypothetical protein n=1 Tax=Clostridium beijerinckii TaxID=1520 RepID=UPI00232B56CD|nr:hypothetical protein [Clostridium beijerinckii]
MGEIKATSFRVSDEDIAKFKEYADKEGYNQAEAFKSIMQTVEMAKAKNLIKDRAKEIEVFQDTINNLMSYFLNSLNVNQTSEERIREELSKELQTKDDTISNLYEQLKECKAAHNYTVDENEKLASRVKELQEQKYKSEKDITDKQSQLDIANRNNNNLQEQVAEYKQYKEQYKALENELEELKTTNINKDNIISSLDNSNKQLNDKIKNDAEMLDFYKSNNAELKDNIKALEQQHKQELQAVKAENEKILEKELNANTEQLQSKHDVEIAKKDLQIQKLQNEIEQLKAKSHRQVNNNKSK